MKKLGIMTVLEVLELEKSIRMRYNLKELTYKELCEEHEHLITLSKKGRKK